jgi:hypothetical protein
MLVPRIVIPAPSTVDDIVFFNSSFAITDYFKWTLNDVSFESTAYKCVTLPLASSLTSSVLSDAVLRARLTFSTFSYPFLARSPLLQQVWRGETIDPGRVATVTAGLGAIDMVINNASRRFFSCSSSTSKF